MKKGELKVTVIATGFQANPKKPSNGSSSPFIQRVTKPMPAAEEEVEVERPSILSRAAAPEVKTPERQVEEVGDDEDDWSAIPAFLRRPK